MYQKIMNDFSMHYSPVTVNKYHKLYCFQHAVDDGLIVINPAARITVKGNTDKVKKEDDKFINHDEVKRLIAAANDGMKNHHLSRYMILIAVSTDMRFA